MLTEQQSPAPLFNCKSTRIFLVFVSSFLPPFLLNYVVGYCKKKYQNTGESTGIT